MSDYQAYFLHVNREDLLQRAVDSAIDFAPNMLIMDSSKNGLSWDAPCEVWRPHTEQLFVQNINYALARTRAMGGNICIWMHSDAVAAPGSCLQLLAEARRLNAANVKWGILFTNYDALVALNANFIDDVGLYDLTLPWYFADDDLYRRIELAGYEKRETGIQVFHEPSQTLNSDVNLAFHNSITFPLYRQYYIAKWGGEPHHETYQHPFNQVTN
jgi:hypothetical protein